MAVWIRFEGGFGRLEGDVVVPHAGDMFAGATPSGDARPLAGERCFRRCSRVSEAEAAAAIFGYTVVDDVTALDLLYVDPLFPQWARAKGRDAFGPVGPAVATGLDPMALTVRTLLNGRERHSYALSDMILPPARIVSLLSRWTGSARGSPRWRGACWLRRAGPSTPTPTRCRPSMPARR